MNRLSTLIPALLAGMLGLSPLPAPAWGRDGHQIVAAIAESRLTTQTLQTVQAILGSAQPLAAVSVWADDVRPQRRETAPWHYVDFPIHTDSFDHARCPNGDCVTMIIDRHRKELASGTNTDPLRRSEMLRYLVHFIGDQAQPLHNANEYGDRGGNGKRVEFFGRQANLHSIWDTHILARYHEESGTTAGHTLNVLNAEIRPEQVRLWVRGTPVDWTTESNRAAIEMVYPGWSPVISRDYFLKSIGTIRLHLQKGGIRLAHVLNQTFDPHRYNGIPSIQRSSEIWTGWRRPEYGIDPAGPSPRSPGSLVRTVPEE
jgi:hypothetical protein